MLRFLFQFIVMGPVYVAIIIVAFMMMAAIAGLLNWILSALFGITA